MCPKHRSHSEAPSADRHDLHKHTSEQTHTQVSSEAMIREIKSLQNEWMDSFKLLSACK